MDPSTPAGPVLYMVTLYIGARTPRGRYTTRFRFTISLKLEYIGSQYINEYIYALTIFLINAV